MVTGDSQWDFLLQAVNRIELKLEKMADTDLQHASQIREVRSELHDVASKMEEKIVSWEKRMKPVESIAERVTAGKTVALWLFATFTGLAGLLGAWSVIRDWVGK